MQYELDWFQWLRYTWHAQISTILTSQPPNLPELITWYRGNQKIDSVYISEDIEESAECFLRSGFTVEYHRGFIIDIPWASLVGEYPLKIPQQSPGVGDQKV